MYFTCMKKSTTRIILVQAMARATTGFQKSVRPGAMCHSPRSMKEAHTVRPVTTSSSHQDGEVDDRADDMVLVIGAVCSLMPRGRYGALALFINIC